MVVIDSLKRDGDLPIGEPLSQHWRSTRVASFSEPFLGKASADYFSERFPTESTRAGAIVKQTVDFLTGDVERMICAPPRGGHQSYRAAGWTWLEFGDLLSKGGMGPERSKVAIVLLSCRPQTATVERPFKEFA
ncbi:hypothetical protein I4F81_007907 [Pyropia yezoensis]|uniref:Uncharacterized protein n=1 Tax=Pyropia yezoensis TaxID=2788 RepID=A0ACC3C5I0_PYRYE|nr:hypothetical protein I4F81_007907 [Neopyropia yezoensis]|eukprot:contig_15676_g3738